MIEALRSAVGRTLVALLALTVASMSALASVRDDAPPRVDALAGVLDRQALKSGDPQTLAKPKELRVAMLLSQNTKAHVAWCNAQTAGLGSIDRGFQKFFGGAQASADSDRAHMLAYDPKFVTDGVTQPLIQRFGDMKLVTSLDEFHGGPFDLLVLVDVSFVNTFSDGFIIGSKYETGTFINAYFLDQSNQLVGKVETGETQDASRNEFLATIARHRQAVMARYQDALTTLLGPITTQGAAAAAPRVPAPERSTAERLRALDDLIKQGLISPADAAAKRAEILKSI